MAEINKLIITVLPMCFGFLLSNALRNGLYESVFVSIIGIIVICLAIILEG